MLQKAASMSNSAKMGANKAAIVNISSELGSIGANTLGSKMPNVAYRMSKVLHFLLIYFFIQYNVIWLLKTIQLVFSRFVRFENDKFKYKLFR